ncbi:MAG TPA: glycosyl hydrolase family 28 protein [Opitutales bacterium]|nr:glycosyl hydrolase family 28 protein [Opitutales bacterium]
MTSVLLLAAAMAASCDNFFQAEIDRVAMAGGGKVVVPAGEHDFKPIRLKSGVTLRLEKGAVLLASTNVADYAVMDGAPVLIGAHDAADIAIEGEGVIDGRGHAFKDKEGRAGESQPVAAPVLMRFSRCRNVRLEDFTFRQAAAWGIHLRNSDGVTIRRVKAFSHINECNDGIDIESRNVLIEDCDFDTDDDALVFKSESDPSFLIENVTVRNCRLASCCNFIKFGTGSYGTWRDILVENCVLGRAKGNWRFDWRKKIPGVKERITGLSAIALEVVDGGSMENVTVRNISWRDGVQTPLFVRLDRRHEPPEGKKTYFRNVRVENVKGTAEGRIACSITGVPGRKISGITLRNVDLTFPGGGTAAEAVAPVPESVGEYPDPYMFDCGALPAWGCYLRHADDIRFENVKLRLVPGARDARKRIVLDDASDPENYSATR